MGIFILEVSCTTIPCGYLRGPARGGGGRTHVARLNFKTSRVGVYKCLLLIVGFAVTVAIWPREVVSCRDFILRTKVIPLKMFILSRFFQTWHKCHVMPFVRVDLYYRKF